MNENANIPQLFRDIFRGVFLPYRDPETLNLFLKEIDGFTYDHSERLGDAYEYLLSVLGTQGDAGQFRTPRHIIDFIVAVVDPQKHETVLDPACGTAGFLISAFKHILKANENLTPDERARLMANFRGYDIAPDMVRLSRVNMYLHGFPSPIIHEYDTLTSEERWDERCDVIMANPPFMTPRGGIRPHNRFWIKAKRSEVLFVDYIAEHLNPGGRAGVIVPEGIIFQSQNAYKALRKMLVENYLWAVASLPAGVFNPYSGVKTSILFLDRSLAKRVDEVLFLKIENDGFDLGAQRRAIEKNDLPEALKAIEEWRATLCRGRDEAMADAMKRLPPVAHAVSRKHLLESPDCNLSGDRYRPAVVRATGKWPVVRLGQVTAINRQSCDPVTLYGENTFAYLDISAVENTSGLISFDNRVKGIEAPSRAKRVVQQGDILLSTVRPNLQAFAYLESVLSDVVASTGFAVLTPTAEKVNGRFLYNLLFSEPVMRQMVGRMGKGAYPSITQSDVQEIEIPLPPLDDQERIVAELEGYRKVIEGARQVIANYKPTIRIDPKWPAEQIGHLSEILSGGTPSKAKSEYWSGTMPWVSPKDMKTERIEDTEDHISNEAVVDSAVNLVPTGAVLCVVRSGILAHSFPVALAGKPLTFNQDIAAIVVDEKQVMPEWLFHVLRRMEADILIRGTKRGGTVHSLQSGFLRELEIPLPPLDIQRRIVAEIEAERALVEANRKLIEVFERKIQDRLAEIWGEPEDSRKETQA